MTAAAPYAYRIQSRGGWRYFRAADVLDVITDHDGRAVEYAFHVSNMNAVHAPADRVEVLIARTTPEHP